jgi:hypothetical protein
MNNREDNIMSDTPLHDAVQSGNVEIVKMLLSSGCDSDVRNDDGLTPLDLAVKTNKTEMVRLLLGTGERNVGNSGVGKTYQNVANPVKDFNVYFSVCWICLIIALPFSCIRFFAATYYEESEAFVLISYLFEIPLLLVSMIFEFMLLYQCWKLIPASIARTTPGKAVGFSFIPLFQFYWWFVAFWGLCKDMNQTLYQRGIQNRANEGLGLAICIVPLVDIMNTILEFITDITIVPDVIYILFIIAIPLVTIFYFKSVKDGASALLANGHQPLTNNQSRG